MTYKKHIITYKSEYAFQKISFLFLAVYFVQLLKKTQIPVGLMHTGTFTERIYSKGHTTVRQVFR